MRLFVALRRQSGLSPLPQQRGFLEIFPTGVQIGRPNWGKETPSSEQIASRAVTEVEMSFDN
jgi:hypothetical protein